MQRPGGAERSALVVGENAPEPGAPVHAAQQTALRALFAFALGLGLPSLPVAVLAIMWYTPCGSRLALSLILASAFAVLTLVALAVIAGYGRLRCELRRAAAAEEYRVALYTAFALGAVSWGAASVAATSYLFAYADACRTERPALFTLGVASLVWALALAFVLSVWQCLITISLRVTQIAVATQPTGGRMQTRRAVAPVGAPAVPPPPSPGPPRAVLPPLAPLNTALAPAPRTGSGSRELVAARTPQSPRAPPALAPAPRVLH